ncbi:UNVERIFIED_CONTAM: hypothetical protein Slati_0884600 [Sesamum latifolium]|uniref:Reverse transcriptase domain-containing protein n=1 Tax=Sesamum latifolium TaxID=2727402 RepID=A0AAW2XNH9_9LAMI
MATQRRGEEVTHAVLDFFQNGRLLKQVNATLLTLIPKVHAPMTVSDFRPISCCNVLNKAIKKILVSRIRECLDDLISTTQNAFVPGRKIGDNVMLAQELFMGYNQQHLPKRGWEIDVIWAARKWRGKHVINAAYRTLLSSLVYHIWQECNRRRFQQIKSSCFAWAVGV